MSLSRQLSVEATELRGVGIQLSRLESVRATKPSGNVIDKFLRQKSEITSVTGKDKQSNVTSALTTRKKEEKSASSLVDTFFKATKHIPDQSKKTLSNAKLIKPMEIDKDILEALPEDIRREVMQEYGLQLQGIKEGPSTDIRPKEPDKPLLYDCGINYSQIDLEVLEELPLEIKKDFQSAVITNRTDVASKTQNILGNSNNKESNLGSSNKSEEPKLDRSLPLSEVRALIKAWTASEDNPQQCDVNMLADYLEGLVTSRQLDKLDICISCLHRCIEKRQSVLWQEAYHAILSGVQSVMVAVYNLHLRVPQTFHSTMSFVNNN